MTFLFGLIFSRILLLGLKPAKEKPEKMLHTKDAKDII